MASSGGVALFIRKFMSHYISVNIAVKPCSHSILLKSVINTKWFSPIGIGGIGRSATSPNKWFMAGYGLESFVSQYCWSDRGAPPSFAFHPTQVTELAPYHEQLATAVKSRRGPTRQLSQFEYISETTQSTYVNGPLIDVSALNAASEWVSSCDSSEVQIHGAFDIAGKFAGNADTSRSFRFLVEPTDVTPIGFPFVTITYNPQLHEVNVFSEASVWLESGNALNSHVDSAAADENVRRLSQMIEVCGTEGMVITEKRLSLGGRQFGAERTRIESTLRI
jgi:hypothetical protein